MNYATQEFIKQTSIVAIGIGAIGRLQWNTDHFDGDTPTTEK